MLEQSGRNILPVTENTLEELNLITKEKIRKYPLKMTNLRVLLKVYAVETYQPYKFYIYGLQGIASEYYMTDKGIEWFYKFFKGKTLQYARSLFSNLFTHATQDDIDHPELYKGFSNFRGVKGTCVKAGSKQPALIIRTVGKAERKYEFDSIADAREQLNVWLTLYPIEEFKLYRIRTKNGYKFKEQIKLVLEIYNLYFSLIVTNCLISFKSLKSQKLILTSIVVFAQFIANCPFPVEEKLRLDNNVSVFCFLLLISKI